METIESTPDPRSAASDLHAIVDAQRAVRDRPWPLWLYPCNAALLGGIALCGLIDSSMIGALVVLALALGLVALNSLAGRIMGTPFAIPTSWLFRVLVIASAVFVILSIPARTLGSDAAVIACAVAAAACYGVGAVVHARRTRR